jgi:hypothetical protein
MPVFYFQEPRLGPEIRICRSLPIESYPLPFSKYLYILELTSCHFLGNLIIFAGLKNT